MSKKKKKHNRHIQYRYNDEKTNRMLRELAKSPEEQKGLLERLAASSLPPEMVTKISTNVIRL